MAGVARLLGHGRDVFYLTGGSARSSLFAVTFGRRKGQVHNYLGGVGKDMVGQTHLSFNIGCQAPRDSSGDNFHTEMACSYGKSRP